MQKYFLCKMSTKTSSLSRFYYLLLIFVCVLHKSLTFSQIIGLVNSNNFGYEFLRKYENFELDGERKNSTTPCEQQLEILKNHLAQNKLWALKFVDAWAKIPAGILYDHNTEMGNFDECLSVRENIAAEFDINGKYCLSSVQVKGLKIGNVELNDKEISLKLGICIPAVCSAAEFQVLFQKYLENHAESFWKNSTFAVHEPECTQMDRGPFNSLDWIAVFILILLGFLMLLSTSFDYFGKKQSTNVHAMLTAFSVRSNLRQLMQMTTPAETPRHIIPALNGIRCLSIIWIIFLHSYMMLITSPNINNIEIDAWSQTPFYMVWKNGNSAVDTFFFLSGLLLISVAFRGMEKTSGKLNVPLMYLHRFIRLSPVLYLAVLLFMTIFRFTGNGPIWNTYTSSYQLCDSTWWATLLYVQNYAAAGRMCLGHSWYLAVDMQLFILSPIVLFLIWKWRRWGLAALLFICLILIACLFTIIMLDELIVFRKQSDPGEDNAEMRLTYYATHARVSPWIIGIIFGYYLHINSGKRMILPKIAVFCGWISSLALFLTVIFALYPKTQPGSALITPLEGAFYLTLSRIAWPLALCWLVFACVNGYAGPINSFLSCKIWQPLSKLSYCMYIWHMLVVMANAGQIKTNSNFSNYDAMLRFWSDFGITILLSTVMYLAIEAPMLGIEKFLLSPKPKEAANRQAATTMSQQNLCD